MATLLEDLVVTAIPSYSLGLTFGTNLFAGLMPDTPDTCVAVFEYPGMAPEHVFHKNIPAISQPKIQVMQRVTEAGYVSGRASLNAVVKALENSSGTVVNATLYHTIERIQDPFFLHRDNNRRIYFACNLQIMKDPE